MDSNQAPLAPLFDPWRRRVPRRIAVGLVLASVMSVAATAYLLGPNTPWVRAWVAPGAESTFESHYGMPVIGTFRWQSSVHWPGYSCIILLSCLVYLTRLLIPSTTMRDELAATPISARELGRSVIKGPLRLGLVVIGIHFGYLLLEHLIYEPRYPTYVIFADSPPGFLVGLTHAIPLGAAHIALLLPALLLTMLVAVLRSTVPGRPAFVAQIEALFVGFLTWMWLTAVVRGMIGNYEDRYWSRDWGHPTYTPSIFGPEGSPFWMIGIGLFLTLLLGVAILAIAQSSRIPLRSIEPRGGKLRQHLRTIPGMLPRFLILMAGTCGIFALLLALIFLREAWHNWGRAYYASMDVLALLSLGAASAMQLMQRACQRSQMHLFADATACALGAAAGMVLLLIYGPATSLGGRWDRDQDTHLLLLLVAGFGAMAVFVDDAFHNKRWPHVILVGVAVTFAAGWLVGFLFWIMWLTNLTFLVGAVVLPVLALKAFCGGPSRSAEPCDSG